MAERHADEIERAFSKQAAAFEDPHHNRIFTTDSEWLFARLPLTADDLVLDVAAGTGHVSRWLAPKVGAVVALDATAAMLERGRAEAPRNVLFMRGDAGALPFLDDSFDVVVCRFAVHHFEQPQIQVAEMRRCLRPGGRLAIGDLIADPEAADAQNRLERMRDPSHTGMLTATQLAALLDTDDIEIRDVERPLEQWLAQTGTPDAAADEIRRALRSELDGGSATGFRPRERHGELYFVHALASVIAGG